MEIWKGGWETMNADEWISRAAVLRASIEALRATVRAHAELIAEQSRRIAALEAEVRDNSNGHRR